MAKIKNDGQQIAKARDKFLKNHSLLLAGEAHGQFLKNRIEMAFIAGWNAARKEK